MSPRVESNPNANKPNYWKGFVCATALAYCGHSIYKIFETNSLRQKAIEEVVKNRIYVMPSFIQAKDGMHDKNGEVIASQCENIAKVIKTEMLYYRENGVKGWLELGVSEGILLRNQKALNEIPHVTEYFKKCFFSSKLQEDRLDCLRPLTNAFWEDLAARPYPNSWEDPRRFLGKK